MDERIGDSTVMARLRRGGLSTVRILAAGALLFAVPAVASAQGAQSDARWQPWLGCWQPNAPSPLGELEQRPASADPGAAVVCVTPARGAAAVDIATISGGKVTSAERIVADGQQRSRTRTGCSGWQSAQFSADGRRVYLRSEDNCSGAKRVASGIIAMSGSREWLDVQGVTSGGRTGVRTVRYRDIGVPETVPAAIARALQGVARPAADARTASAAPLTATDVVDASRKVDAAVVRSWLLARGEGFALDAQQLVKLADAGVPGEVTDAMVALSYPRTFAIVDRAALRGAQDGVAALGTAGGAYTTGGGRVVQAYIDPYAYGYDYSPFGFGYSSYGFSPYGFSPYGYSGYGYPYGYGYRTGPGAGYGFYNTPVIVLRGSGQAPVEHGAAIKGYGYSRDGSGDGSRSAVGERTRSNTQPTAAAGASGRTGSPPASTGRTAKPRP